MLSDVIQDDSAEICHLRAGGEEELSRLFAKYRPNLAKMVKYRISAPLQARIDESDLIQEGYLEAARQLPEYLESQELPPNIWIRRIVKQVLSRHIRFHVDTAMRSTRREYENNWIGNAESSSMIFALADSIASPLSCIANQEAFTELWQLLDSLDPVQRNVLCLKQLEGLTFQEVAAELEMDISAVKRSFQRAVLRLSKIAAHLA